MKPPGLVSRLCLVLVVSACNACGDSPESTMDAGGFDSGPSEDGSSPEGLAADAGGKEGNAIDEVDAEAGTTDAGADAGADARADAESVCTLQAHDTCGAGLLCCENQLAGQNACVPEDTAHCEACDEGCGANADNCSEGTCRCGDSPACGDATPVCLDGTCTAESETCVSVPSLCADQGLTCDAETFRCVDALRPWRPDCANLPVDAACSGGPVAVLLATHASGRIAMLDPADGHFLGYLKPNNLDARTTSDIYRFATQGPDMCVWTVREAGTGTGGVERWDTDGAFVDAIIPAGADTREESNGSFTKLVDDPTSLAFDADSVYVASPVSASPMVTRFDLDGNLIEVALDDGSEVESLEVLGDGTFVMLDNENYLLVRYDPTTGVRTHLWELPSGGQQVSFSRQGHALVTTSTAFADVDLATEQRTTLAVENAPGPYGTGYLGGVGALTSGSALVTRSSNGPHIGVLDPEATSSAEVLTPVWSDPAVERLDYWQQIGHACVPQAVIEAAAPTAPETSCPGGPAGEVLYEENFESNPGLAGITNVRGLASVDTTLGAAATTTSLRIDGDPDSRFEGATLPLAMLQPSYVGFFVRYETADARDASDNRRFSGYYALSAASTADPHTGGQVYNSYHSGWQGRYSALVQDQTWHRVELRNIDWNARSYDFYLDCERLAERVPLAVDSGDDLRRIDFYQPIAGIAMWVDEVVVR